MHCGGSTIPISRPEIEAQLAVSPPGVSERELMGISRTSFLIARLMLPAALAAGASYALAQLLLHGRLEDPAFILLLLASTAVLLAGEHLLRRHMLRAGLEFYRHSGIGIDPVRASEEHACLFKSTWASAPRLIGGFLYAAAVAAGGHWLSRWGLGTPLAWLLTVFLFTVNFGLGGALVSLYRFLRHCPRLFELVTVDIWNLYNPSVRYLIEAAAMIGIVGVVALSLSLTAIRYSYLGAMDNVTYMYGAVFLSLVAVGVFLPYVPIAVRASAQKRSVDRQLARLIGERIGQVHGVADGQIEPEHIEQLAQLIRIREHVAAISVLPFKSRALASFGALLATVWLPMLKVLKASASAVLGLFGLPSL